jgi:hypothetical protein
VTADANAAPYEPAHSMTHSGAISPLVRRPTRRSPGPSGFGRWELSLVDDGAGRRHQDRQSVRPSVSVHADDEPVRVRDDGHGGTDPSYPSGDGLAVSAGAGPDWSDRGQVCDESRSRTSGVGQPSDRSPRWAEDGASHPARRTDHSEGTQFWGHTYFESRPMEGQNYARQPVPHQPLRHSQMPLSPRRVCLQTCSSIPVT